MSLPSRINNGYEDLKGFRLNLCDSKCTDLLIKMANDCMTHLANYKRISLVSHVEGKDYFSFYTSGKYSRPVLKDKWIEQETCFTQKLGTFGDAIKSNSYSAISSEEISTILYSIAINFCCIVDLEKSGDQKTPGTFFEYLIGHCFAMKLRANPCKEVDVLNLDRSTKLPTDFVFDLGKEKPKFHLPVKTSTRERVIQVWAHQRLLDGVYGTGRFWGTLACLAETKLDNKTKVVTEICLPDQWKLYQLFISQMKRIYYLDIPKKYEDLNNSFPKIPVKSVGEFFFEADDLTKFN